ncbi:NADH-dependent [FeFe] hydrogenase, group A6 [Parasporobacterium paucivorans]|uniref:NAD(P)-dependent iron-only hydrogenase catalytic subunit n=1 Tax=Parasporobacterium paucivorans DSM 15970 TaxID=1122934 RepID=A0A1M6J3W0_9FIRM|nr:NADH-dependent [FeFe] hydrogenase, group A6 [Parasporobacterium paucivorans]SHJ41352.1 NAD(P)-dependent iron-only hydrogenase catalytic subunit [Parasporobacterium paucivorans DSM 15970]
MVNINIDGINLQVEEGTTIMEAAKKIHVNIPSLCHHEDQSVKSVCRICVVEVNGQKLLQPACSYPVAESMSIRTNTPRIIKARKNILELIFSHHPQDCLNCDKNGSCELQSIAQDLNMNSPIRYEVELRGKAVDTSSPSITFDANKCILCGRCVEVCNDVQTVGILAKENRGYNTVVAPPYGKKLQDTACVNCGQCVQVCPVGALTIHDDTNLVYKAKEEGKVLIAQVAPSSRTTIAEALGEETGTVSTGRMITAMKMLGFDYVFDTDFTADLTIMEEGNELLNRITNGGVLPMMTSCCPGWVKFCETSYPKYTQHLSSAKSPQQMFGSVIKTYFAQKAGIDPANIFSCSIMPCTAKKFECKRPEMSDSGYQDVDAALTVQELAKLIKSAGIDFSKLEESRFDNPFGLGSGAGEIFAATGGVMEAALRTVYEVLTGEELKQLEFQAVRGFEGLKEAAVDINGTTVKVAVVHSLGEARKIMDRVVDGTADYHFIEVMACPGGCIGGGGNPVRNWKKVAKRTVNVYQQDKDLPIRKSHESPAIKMIYEEFLGEPLSETSHHLLHTKYANRQDILRI